MKQTDKRIFFKMRPVLQAIKQLSVGILNVDVAFRLFKPEKCLKGFFQKRNRKEGSSTIPLQDARQAAEQLRKMFIGSEQKSEADTAVNRKFAICE